MFRPFTLAIFMYQILYISLPSYSCVRQIHTLQSSLIINTTWMMNLMITILLYRYAPHDDVSVNDGPHVRHWSYKIMILLYNILIPLC